MQAQKWVENELLLTEYATKLWASTGESNFIPIQHYAQTQAQAPNKGKQSSLIAGKQYQYADWLLHKYIPHCRGNISNPNFTELIYKNDAQENEKLWKFWEEEIQPLEIMLLSTTLEPFQSHQENNKGKNHPRDKISEEFHKTGS